MCSSHATPNWTHERDKVSKVLWVAAPRETSRRRDNGAPELDSFSGMSTKTRRADPWQNPHTGCFAQHSVQMVECGGRSLSEEIIPVARSGEPIRAMVERHGDDMHRRTARCRKRVDAGVAPTLARLQESTPAAFHETLQRNHCDLDGYRRGRKPPSRRTWQRVCHAEQTSLWEHLSGGVDQLTPFLALEVISVATSLDLKAVGFPSTVLMSSSHFEHTSLSPRCRASDSVMTMRTPNRSMLFHSRCRPCCTLTESSSAPVFAPKMRFWCSTMTNTLDSVVVTHGAAACSDS